MIHKEILPDVKGETVIWETDRPSHVLELEAIVVSCRTLCRVIFKRQNKDGKESEVLIAPIISGYAPNAVIPLYREQVNGRQRLAVEVEYATEGKEAPVDIVLINTRR